MVPTRSHADPGDCVCSLGSGDVHPESVFRIARPLNQKPSACYGCPSYGDGEGFVPASGSGANKILLVGDLSTTYESKIGKPFVGQHGFALDRVLRRAGLDRNAFRLINSTCCNAAWGWPGYEAVAHCKTSHVEAAIAAMRPQAIVAMGNLALRTLTGFDGIMRYRGRVVPSEYGWVIPTLHPKDLIPQRGKPEQAGPKMIRNPARMTGAVIWDLKKALQVAKGGFKREEPTYLCDPPPDEFAAFATEFENALERDDVLLSWDIETPYKLKAKDEDEFEESERDTTILRISFSYRENHGVSVPWVGPYMPTIKRLLRSRGTHVVWNGDSFDVPMVRANGVEVGGEVQDFMWGWHVYQSDLPMGLEFVSSFFTDILPWKHLNNSAPALYSCIDSDAALQIALGLRAALRGTGQLPIFRRHVVELDPVLQRAGEHGNVIDQIKQEELRGRLNLEWDRIDGEVQGVVPEELKPRKRYKKAPKIAPGEARTFEEVAATGKVKRCTICHALRVKKTDHFKGGKKNVCKVAGGEIETIIARVTEWDEILPFNVNSPPQVKAYINHFGHPMGQDKKDKEKETSDSKHLIKLAKQYGGGHPVYQMVVDSHKVGKALSTYVDGFKADKNGLIHTSYTHAPSTWRLSSRNVNLQNVGKRASNPWALEARETITARPGHVLVQADSSAIEAVFVGYYMGDEAYINLARKGVHDYLTCYSLGHKIPQAEFDAAFVKKVKALIGPEAYKEQREKAKRVVHGTNYGMGPKLMCEEYPETFRSKQEAEGWQRLLYEACPTLKKWQHETRVRAHRETFLENPWKIRHYFYHVFTTDSFGQVVIGTDSNRAVAFLPQSGGGCFMKDNLVLIDQTWLGPYMPANISVHDGYCVDVPAARAEDAAKVLEEILTRPIPEMGGLRVGCEIEVGFNWGAYDEIKNPRGMKGIRKVEVA